MITHVEGDGSAENPFVLVKGDGSPGLNGDEPVVLDPAMIRADPTPDPFLEKETTAPGQLSLPLDDAKKFENEAEKELVDIVKTLKVMWRHTKVLACRLHNAGHRQTGQQLLWIAADLKDQEENLDFVVSQGLC